jgi:hypothetical protein
MDRFEERPERSKPRNQIGVYEQRACGVRFGVRPRSPDATRWLVVKEEWC